MGVARVAACKVVDGVLQDEEARQCNGNGASEFAKTCGRVQTQMQGCDAMPRIRCYGGTCCEKDVHPSKRAVRIAAASQQRLLMQDDGLHQQ